MNIHADKEVIQNILYQQLICNRKNIPTLFPRDQNNNNNYNYKITKNNKLKVRRDGRREDLTLSTVRDKFSRHRLLKTKC